MPCGVNCSCPVLFPIPIGGLQQRPENKGEQAFLLPFFATLNLGRYECLRRIVSLTLPNTDAENRGLGTGDEVREDPSPPPRD